MVELMQQLMEIVKGMPQLAIWVLAGILFYKTVIVGSVFGILKLLINKGASVMSQKDITYKIETRFVDPAVLSEFMALLNEVDGLHSGYRINTSVIQKVRKAIRETNG